MTTDPIADMISRIKNGYMARNKTVEIPFSNVKKSLALLLQKKGYLDNVVIDKEGKKFTVYLIYKNEVPALTEIKRESKPGLRRYLKLKNLINIRQGLGYYIISTPKGLMTHVEAKTNKLGGEIICRIW